MNNNQMESFNGNTLRQREKVTRSLKKDDSAILFRLRLYHNFVRPHLGLPDNTTLAQVAGIEAEDANSGRHSLRRPRLRLISSLIHSQVTPPPCGRSPELTSPCRALRLSIV